MAQKRLVLKQEQALWATPSMEELGPDLSRMLLQCQLGPARRS